MASTQTTNRKKANRKARMEARDLTEQLKMAQERSSSLEAQVRDAVGRLVSCAAERDQLRAALEEERIGRKEDQAALERERAEVERVKLVAERTELRQRLMRESHGRLGKALDEFYGLAKELSRDFEDEEEGNLCGMGEGER
ncbi:unnamed protein product [Linum trigynum]|uniref:Uncharacterized protein n=1 Tax=Linum trigynum TaxID=586398 RepID=A0AAV2G0G8_9ROSI